MLCHDPRLGDDRSKKVKTNNRSLINAEEFRKKWPNHKMDWDKVARFADQCDEVIPQPVKVVEQVKKSQVRKRKKK